jgi:plastocyanin
LLLLPFLAANPAAAEEKRPASKYVCSEPHPATFCNASNTCGSASEPCAVDVKRTGNAASATPSIPNAKGNKLFCVKAGTTVTWQSKSKDTGFVIDLGPTSPFEPAGSIIGGSEKPVSVVAKTAGCYKYSVGACLSGAVMGMCGSAETDLIVTN